MLRTGIQRVCSFVGNCGANYFSVQSLVKIAPNLASQPVRTFLTKPTNVSFPLFKAIPFSEQRFLAPKEPLVTVAQRNLTKFSLRSGKRKTVKAVLKRFYRLDWGIWIHAKCGRAKKLFRKSPARKRRLRQHVFANATQSYLLDKMVTRYWRKPRFYPEDPYNPYHKRENFPLTRKAPLPPSA